jgi:hypothetical protein
LGESRRTCKLRCGVLSGLDAWANAGDAKPSAPTTAIRTSLDLSTMVFLLMCTDQQKAQRPVAVLGVMFSLCTGLFKLIFLITLIRKNERACRYKKCEVRRSLNALRRERHRDVEKMFGTRITPRDPSTWKGP